MGKLEWRPKINEPLQEEKKFERKEMPNCRKF
jgi:hypothetical protein